MSAVRGGGWVKGVKNGRPYYLNLVTHQESVFRPLGFEDAIPRPSSSPGGGSGGGGGGGGGGARAKDGSVEQQDCTDDAVNSAAEQLRAGTITQEEYDVIVAIAAKAQEVDDVDQFLNHGKLQKFQSTESLPQDVSADPELMITDLSTGRKAHVVEAENIAPVHAYDSFENLYVKDITTGKRIFLADVQLEQFDTFNQTQKKLGDRAGAAELRRQAKKLRDAAPTELRVKLFDALSDLNGVLRTPRGQEALRQEAAFFGGSLVKTRMAMVMAVQMKLKRMWERKAAASPRRSGKRKKRGRRGKKSSRDRDNEEVMTLVEFVDVVQFMGFDATLERAAEVVARWGKADVTGRIHFVNFLLWCDLETVFPRTETGSGFGDGAFSGSGSASVGFPRHADDDAIDAAGGGGAAPAEDADTAVAAYTQDLLAAADELTAAEQDYDLELEGAPPTKPLSPRSRPGRSVYADDDENDDDDDDDDDDGDDDDNDDDAVRAIRRRDSGLSSGTGDSYQYEDDDDDDAEDARARLELEETQRYRLLQQQYSTVMGAIEKVREEYAASGELLDEAAVAAAVASAANLKAEMERMDAEREATLRRERHTKAADLAVAALAVQHTQLEGWEERDTDRSTSGAAAGAGASARPDIAIARTRSADLDSGDENGTNGGDDEDDLGLPPVTLSRPRSGTWVLLSQKHDAIVAGIAAARAQQVEAGAGGAGGGEEAPAIVAAEVAADKLRQQMELIEAESGGNADSGGDGLGSLPSDTDDGDDDTDNGDDARARLAQAAASGAEIARSHSADARSGGGAQGGRTLAARKAAIARSRSANMEGVLDVQERMGPALTGRPTRPPRGPWKIKAKRHTLGSDDGRDDGSVGGGRSPLSAALGVGGSPANSPGSHSGAEEEILATAEAVHHATQRRREMQAQLAARLPPARKLDIAHMEPLSVAKVCGAYTAEGPSELSAIVGEVLAVYQRNADSGWWYCMNELGEEGYVPVDHLVPVSESDVAQAHTRALAAGNGAGDHVSLHMP